MLTLNIFLFVCIGHSILFNASAIPSVTQGIAQKVTVNNLTQG
jgi:uncharacterized metal-binding protein